MQVQGDQRGLSARRDDAAALMILAGSLACFALIAIAVHNNWLIEFDRSVLRSLRATHDPMVPLGPYNLTPVVRDITALGGFAVLSSTVLAVAGYLAFSGRGDRALVIIGYTLGGTLVGEAAKHIFLRARPDIVPHLIDVVTLSFPSAHAMQSTVVWFTLLVVMAGAQAQPGVKAYLLVVAAIVAIAVGMSRIYLGVHWPTDVLAGWTLGIAWVAACWLLDQRLCKRRSMAM